MITCYNHSHARHIDLQTTFGLPALTVDGIIQKYHEATGQIEKYPSVEEVNAMVLYREPVTRRMSRADAAKVERKYAKDKAIEVTTKDFGNGLDNPQATEVTIKAKAQIIDIVKFKEILKDAKKKVQDDVDNFTDDEVAYQREPQWSDKAPDEQLDMLMRNFLDKLGVKVDYAGVRDRFGNEIPNAVARAKYIQENNQLLINIAENRAGLDTLTEEAAHIMVWMMRGTPLYNSMMNEINGTQTLADVYAEYEGVYTADIQFKEEAIVKRITAAVVEKVQDGMSEEEANRMNRWFNKAIQWFKELIGAYKNDSFNQAAYKMIFNDTIGLSKANIKRSEEAYQLDSVDSIYDRIKNRVLTRLEKNGRKFYVEGDFTYPISVTEWRDQNKQWPDRTQAQKDRDEVLRQLGSYGHEDIENSFLRHLEARENPSSTPKTALVTNLTPAARAAIDNLVVSIIASYPVDARFILEHPIGDKRKGRAGSPDIIVIYKGDEGKVKLDILDWKFLEFKSDGKTIQSEMAKYKKESYQKQIKEYKRILQDAYGVGNTINVSLIPIGVNLVKQKDGSYLPSSIEAGTMGYDEKKPQLNRIPLETERTGNKTIDAILDGLVKQKEKIKEIKAGDDVRVQSNKAERIAMIDKAIKKIILTKDIADFFTEANYELTKILASNDTNELVTALEVIPFYKQLNFSEYRKTVPTEQINEIEAKINKFRSLIEDAEVWVKNKLTDKGTELADNFGVDDINIPQKDIGFWTKYLSTFSTQENPYLRTLFKLITKAKDTARTTFEGQLQDITKLNQDVINYAKANGIKESDTFKFMYKTDKNGNIILIDKFSPEARAEVKKAREDKDYAKLRKVLNFDKARYDERYKHNKEFFEEYFRDSPNKDKLVKDRLESFKKAYDVTTSNFAVLNTNNYFTSLNEAELPLSNEYKHVQSTPELKAFYDYFTSFVQTSRKDLGLEYNYKFIPQVTQSLIEAFKKKGTDLSLADTFWDSVSVNDMGGFGEVNSLTGNPEYNITMSYQNNLGDKASTDLGKVLALWAKQANDTKQLSDIENATKILKANLEQQQFIVTNVTGEAKIDKESGEVELVNALGSNTLQAFTDYMNEALYKINLKGDKAFTKKRRRVVYDENGQPKKENGKVVTEEYEMSVSTFKILDKLLKYVSSKTLGFNIISAGANLQGGIINGIYEGSKGRFYSKRNFLNAVRKVSAGKLNPKTMTALRYFDIMGDMEGFNKANALSVSAADRWFTYDKIFTLQKKGDSLIVNSILTAMLETHGIVDGKIKHLKQAPEGTKSLADSMEIVGENLVIPGLTDNKDNTEYLKFRAKVHELSKNILGNSPAYDIRLANQTILGRVALQFRGWMPRMAEARFSGVRYNDNLEAFEQGKFNSYFSFLASNITSNTTQVLATLVGIGGNDLKKTLEAKWNTMSNEEKSKYLKNTATEEEAKEAYVNLQVQEIKAAVFEIHTILGVLALFLFAKPDPDEKEKASGLQKMYFKSVDRLFNEISFFVLPSSFNDIVRNAIPLSSTLIDINNIFVHGFGDAAGRVIGDEDMIDKYKFLKNVGKALPFTHEVVKDATIVLGDNYWEDFEIKEK